jgi:hypothetical protein
MSEREKSEAGATVNEEPTSSATTNRQINQGNPDETRETGKKPSQGEQRQKEQGPVGCNCG